jgi:hypothetical protein
MSLFEDQRREWFEGYVQRKLGIRIDEGDTTIEIRRERIRQALITAKLGDVVPSETSGRTWGELFEVVYSDKLQGDLCQQQSA